MDKLDATIANLRVALAEVALKESQLQATRQQFRAQLSRMPSLVLYGKTTLDSALAMMEDVEQRLAQIEASLRYLSVIKQRAQEELEALELTRSIEQAKAELASLRADAQASSDEGRLAEIRHLQRLINEASERAAKSLAEPH